MNIRNFHRFAATILIVTGCVLPAAADEPNCSINWTKLNLSPQQSERIQSLDNKWNEFYVNLQSSIVNDQRKLTQLLSDPKSDPVEIMALQQSITRKREQLRSKATATYLRKRQLLNDQQQVELQNMVKRAIAERRRINSMGTQPANTDRIQNLMQRVRNIWPMPGSE